MPYTSVVISSGHGSHVAGAVSILNEVTEARRTADALGEALKQRGVAVKVFHDNTSYDPNTNLKTICSYHNAQSLQLDISIHLNAYEYTASPRGTECFYVTQETLARNISNEISRVGFINRGPKYGGELYFLKHTSMPAVLIELCFVDSESDAITWRANGVFEKVVTNLADLLGGKLSDSQPIPPPSGELLRVTGRVSWFGGPDDTGVSASEGLAFHYEINDGNQHLFLPTIPPGTTGLARRLNTAVPYVACRWDYSVTPKEMLAGSGQKALVRRPR